MEASVPCRYDMPTARMAISRGWFTCCAGDQSTVRFLPPLIDDDSPNMCWWCARRGFYELGTLWSTAACCAGRTRYLAAGCAVIAVIVAKCLFKYRRLPPHRRTAAAPAAAAAPSICSSFFYRRYNYTPLRRSAAPPLRPRERPLMFCFPTVCDATTVVYFAR